MIETIVCVAVGVLAVLVALICYAACIGLLDEDSKLRRDEKHRNHHRWQGGHGRQSEP